VVFFGGILGALIAFTIGILFTEVWFTNDSEWPTVIPFALAVAGWLAGTATIRSVTGRSPNT
jgi:hypothetical protein